MWRYYALLTDLTPDQVEAEQARAQPMASEDGAGAGGRWRTSTAPTRRARPRTSGGESTRSAARRRNARGARARGRAALQGARVPGARGLASKSEAMRLLRARAVKREGVVVEAGGELGGRPLRLSIGPARFYRIEQETGESPA